MCKMLGMRGSVTELRATPPGPHSLSLPLQICVNHFTPIAPCVTLSPNISQSIEHSGISSPMSRITVQPPTSTFLPHDRPVPATPSCHDLWSWADPGCSPSLPLDLHDRTLYIQPGLSVMTNTAHLGTVVCCSATR